MKNINEYQLHASRTIPQDKTYDEREDFYLRKLATEVLEIQAELLDKNYTKANVVSELGDALRCIAQLATLNNIKMEKILDHNIKKMDKRFNNNPL